MYEGQNMKIEHLGYLRCPVSKEPLTLSDEVVIAGKIKEGVLETKTGEHRYPIINFIPRFVSQDNYASNYGLEWNIHAKTQYDDE